MADDPLPFIEEKDYGEFQSIFENAALPDYGDWLELHEREKRDREGKGLRCFAVQVAPDNFVEFCRSHGQEPKEVDNGHFRKLLLSFAVNNAQPPHVISDYDPHDSKD